MTIDRRILIDPHGAVLSAGRKVSTVKGLERASNDTQRVFESWCRWKPTGRLPRLNEIYPHRMGDTTPSIMVVDVLEADVRDLALRHPPAGVDDLPRVRPLQGTPGRP